jgi:chitinase
LEKIVGGYWANWPTSQIRLREVPDNYNLIYLFAARPVGGSPGTTGAVEWTPPGDGRGAATNFLADLAYVRGEQGRKVILSVGGQGGGMSFPSREKSQAFVASIESLYEEFGGFDGLDWNTFEADQAPDTEEMIWISLELKALYPGFMITAPPAPWNNLDKAFCQQMVAAGAMDYVAPQYYDGPGLAVQSYVESNVDEWVGLVGADKLVVGFGIWDQENYMGIEEAISTWNAVSAKHPTLRGGFEWAIHLDEGLGWPFATELGPVINPWPQGP